MRLRLLKPKRKYWKKKLWVRHAPLFPVFSFCVCRVGSVFRFAAFFIRVQFPAFCSFFKKPSILPFSETLPWSGTPFAILDSWGVPTPNVQTFTLLAAFSEDTARVLVRLEESAYGFTTLNGTVPQFFEASFFRELCNPSRAMRLMVGQLLALGTAVVDTDQFNVFCETALAILSHILREWPDLPELEHWKQDLDLGTLSVEFLSFVRNNNLVPTEQLPPLPGSVDGGTASNAAATPSGARVLSFTSTPGSAATSLGGAVGASTGGEPSNGNGVPTPTGLEASSFADLIAAAATPSAAAVQAANNSTNGNGTTLQEALSNPEVGHCVWKVRLVYGTRVFVPAVLPLDLFNIMDVVNFIEGSPLATNTELYASLFAKTTALSYYIGFGNAVDNSQPNHRSFPDSLGNAQFFNPAAAPHLLQLSQTGCGDPHSPHIRVLIEHKAFSPYIKSKHASVGSSDLRGAEGTAAKLFIWGQHVAYFVLNSAELKFGAMVQNVLLPPGVSASDACKKLACTTLWSECPQLICALMQNHIFYSKWDQLLTALQSNQPVDPTVANSRMVTLAEGYLRVVNAQERTPAGGQQSGFLAQTFVPLHGAGRGSHNSGGRGGGRHAGRGGGGRHGGGRHGGGRGRAYPRGRGHGRGRY